MKNQYVGDIGDYGKYGLLRFLAEKGVLIGVNWYLTENDGTDDGKFRDYKEEDRIYNIILFEKLKPIAAKKKNERTVFDIENAEIIPNAVFYKEMLKSADEATRKTWHQKAMETLRDVDLVFADPDNGTKKYSKEKKGYYRNNGEKYALVNELQQYFDEEKDIVYYCHKGRRKKDAWKEKMKEFNADGQHDASIFVLTFHRGTQRSFIFAIHPENKEKYNKWLQEFVNTGWGKNILPGKKVAPFTWEEVL